MGFFYFLFFWCVYVCVCTFRDYYEKGRISSAGVLASSLSGIQSCFLFIMLCTFNL